VPQLRDESRSYRAGEIESFANRLVGALSTSLGISAEDLAREKSFLHDLGTDSLDTVELLMELEDELGITVSDDETRRLTTASDAIAFLQAHRRTP
jgi:acyl carrier protein